MASIQLKVSTKAMKAKADQVSAEIKQTDAQWKKLQETVKNSKGYWQGDASNLHQKYLTEVKADVDKILRRLKEHPTDLLKMANIYDGAETKAGSMSGKLPKNVI